MTKYELRNVQRIGEKFHRLTVLEILPGSGRAKWKCKCECGRITIANGASIASGNTTSCGCFLKQRISESRLVDFSGKTVGHWTVLYRAPNKRKPSGAFAVWWRCRCRCGIEKDVNAGSLQSGTSLSCGCTQRDRLGFGVASLRRWLVSYKNSAVRRGLPFLLSDTEFTALVSLPCHYCGSQPTIHNCHPLRPINGRVAVNGLDRKNPNLGYTVGNVVPCCKTCNRAKMVMSYSEFVAWIQMAARHLEATSVLGTHAPHADPGAV